MTAEEAAEADKVVSEFVRESETWIREYGCFSFHALLAVFYSDQFDYSDALRREIVHRLLVWLAGLGFEVWRMPSVDDLRRQPVRLHFGDDSPQDVADGLLDGWLAAGCPEIDDHDYVFSGPAYIAQQLDWHAHPPLSRAPWSPEELERAIGGFIGRLETDWLDDIGIGLGIIVDVGLNAFQLGRGTDAFLLFLRDAILELLKHGAEVWHIGTPLEPDRPMRRLHYGSGSPEDMAAGIITEWEVAGEPDLIWGDYWFAYPDFFEEGAK